MMAIVRDMQIDLGPEAKKVLRALESYKELESAYKILTEEANTCQELTIDREDGIKYGLSREGLVYAIFALLKNKYDSADNSTS